MVYTDGVHLVADTLAELHEFARRIGLKRRWFQDHRLQHYDLTSEEMVRKAIDAGAVMVTSRQIVMIARRMRCLEVESA